MNESILIGETGLDLTKLLTDGFYYVYMKTSKKSNQEILKINAHHWKQNQIHRLISSYYDKYLDIINWVVENNIYTNDPILIGKTVSDLINLLTYGFNYVYMISK